MSKWKIRCAVAKSKLRRIRCNMFGHDWKHVGYFYVAIPGMNKYRCSHCKIRNRPQTFMQWIHGG